MPVFDCLLYKNHAVTLRPVEGADSSGELPRVSINSYITYGFSKIVLIAWQYILQSVKQDCTARGDILAYKV